jgi:hypothetical protein
MTRTCRLFLALPLFLIVVSGCKTSSSPARVSGTVTYKGETVPTGSVTFHTEQGAIFSYPLVDGTYSGSDLPTGEMVVTVETESANPEGTKGRTYGGGKAKGGDPSDYAEKMKQMGKVPAGAANKGPYVPIPKKYSDKNTSPLKVTLTKGNNKLDFPLED